MSALYTVVDQSHWKRAMHCAVFRNCIEPAFCITVELDVTPLFDWGKWEIREGKRLLPFSIQAHHSFVDGLHVARLVEKIQNSLDNL